MKKKLWLGLAATFLMVGCQKPADKKDDEKPEDKTEEVEHKEEDVQAVSLVDWAGEWNSIGHYLDHKELDSAFEEAAEKDGVTAEEARKEFEEEVHADFNGLVIEGESIAFYDDFPEEDGAEEIAKSNYEYVEAKELEHAGQKFYWYVFEAEEADAKYPTLLLMEIHGEESLTHYHIRYGNDVDELLKLDDWWPTFVRPNSTYDQIAEEILE